MYNKPIIISIFNLSTGNNDYDTYTIIKYYFRVK